MKLLVVGEGPDEVGQVDDVDAPNSLAILVLRLLDRPSGWTVDRKYFLPSLGRHVHRDVRNIGHGWVRRVKRHIRDAGDEHFDAIFVVVDHDRDRKRATAIRKGVDDLMDETAAAFACESVVGFAIETFDAWMLADRQALENALKIDVGKLPSPENLNGKPGTDRHPKRRMKDMIDRSHASVDHPSQLYPKLAEALNLERLEKLCPKGFGVFAKDVRRVGQALRSRREP